MEFINTTENRYFSQKNKIKLNESKAAAKTRGYTSLIF
jgi:hypothetical protein